MLSEILAVILDPPPFTQEDIDAVIAVNSGDPTPEQLAHCTNKIHRHFDEHDGCMVDTVREGAENGYPHYAMNHAIRTYVRAADLREAKAQDAARDDLNARYGKDAQTKPYRGGLFDQNGFHRA